MIVFAYHVHPGYSLILAANRDELYTRPTAPLAYWNEAPEILAGRDLVNGGTWLGITRDGRFAAVTNYRDPRDLGAEAPSRGLLASNFLRGVDSPQVYLQGLQARACCYNGFNLLVGDTGGLYYFCNRGSVMRELGAGLYGLSNRWLDTPWPKVQRAKQALKQLIDAGRIQPEYVFNLLADRDKPADAQLPDTGISLERERQLSSIFISSQDYGTRSSTIVLIGHDGSISVTERDTLSGDLNTYRWQIASP